MGKGVTVKSSGGGGTVSKGAISTPFKDAIFTPKGVSSPAPVSKNK